MESCVGVGQIHNDGRVGAMSYNPVGCNDGGGHGSGYGNGLGNIGGDSDRISGGISNGHYGAHHGDGFSGGNPGGGSGSAPTEYTGGIRQAFFNAAARFGPNSYGLLDLLMNVQAHGETILSDDEWTQIIVYASDNGRSMLDWNKAIDEAERRENTKRAKEAQKVTDALKIKEVQESKDAAFLSPDLREKINNVFAEVENEKSTISSLQSTIISLQVQLHNRVKGGRGIVEGIQYRTSIVKTEAEINKALEKIKQLTDSLKQFHEAVIKEKEAADLKAKEDIETERVKQEQKEATEKAQILKESEEDRQKEVARNVAIEKKAENIVVAAKLKHSFDKAENARKEFDPEGEARKAEYISYRESKFWEEVGIRYAKDIGQGFAIGKFGETLTKSPNPYLKITGGIMIIGNWGYDVYTLGDREKEFKEEQIELYKELGNILPEDVRIHDYFEQRKLIDSKFEELHEHLHGHYIGTE